jgi:hypothetical protein
MKLFVAVIPIFVNCVRETTGIFTMISLRRIKTMLLLLMVHRIAAD